jgi:hypothetical protein
MKKVGKKFEHCSDVEVEISNVSAENNLQCMCRAHSYPRCTNTMKCPGPGPQMPWRSMHIVCCLPVLPGFKLMHSDTPASLQECQRDMQALSIRM